MKIKAFVISELISFQIQLVHWNQEYGSFDEAASSENGIAVLSVLVKVPVRPFLTGVFLTWVSTPEL